jgi:beta-glucanase (GH16 family)
VVAVIAVALALAATGAGLALVHRSMPPSSNASVPATRQAHLDPLGRDGYSFDDEFTGPAGASPNYGLGKRYWFTDPCWHTGCGSPAAPTRYEAANAYLNGRGDLVLVARRGATGRCGDVACAYTSARLTMVNWNAGGDPVSFSQRYGTFSARIKLPAGAGLWPAFWLVGSDIGQVGWPASGEIDALEVFTASGRIQQHVEYGSAASVQRYGRSYPLPPGQSPTGWHTYAVTWSPSGITWKVDGSPTLFLSAAQAGADWSQFERPFSVILDLALGGIAGLPTGATHLPAKMLVDWVHISTHD